MADRCGNARINLLDLPSRFSTFTIYFPPPESTEICVTIIARPHSLRQAIHLLHVAASEHDNVGNKGKLQLRNGVAHFLAPGLFAEAINGGFPEPILNFAMIAIREVAQ